MGLHDFVPVLDGLRETGTPATAHTALLALEALINRGQALATALARYEAGTTARIGVAFETVPALGLALGQFIETYFGDTAYPPDLFLAARSAQQAVWSLQHVRRAFADQTALTAADGVLSVRPDGRGLIPYRLHQGDTLERLALRLLGSVDRSWEIIELNGLAWPFICADRPLAAGDFTTEFDPTAFVVFAQPSGGGRVATTGDVLWLPPDAELGVDDSLVTDRDVALYGRDLRMDDRVLHPNGIGELATIEGIDNMAQAIRHRIATLRGELVLHSEYGIEKRLAVGIEGSEANVVFAGLAVGRAVLQDPRVVTIRDLRIHFSGTTNRVSMTIGLIGGRGRTLPLNEVVSEAG